MLNKIINILTPRHYRYIIIGFLTFTVNLGIANVIFSMEYFQNSELNKNLGNILAAEFALLFSYPFHKRFTWLEGWENFWSKLIYFHIVSLGGFLVRALVFFLLGLIPLSWPIATSFSVACTILFNFAFFDNYVFKSKLENTLENKEVYSHSGAGIATLETIEEARTYNLWIASKIEDYLGEKNLELGAGTGTIANLISENFPVELFELSEANQYILKERFDLNTNIKSIHGDYLNNEQWNQYDCVYSSNVLEHIEDDVKFVEHGLRLLRKGGFFVAIVPAMQILYSDFDRSIGHQRRYGSFDKVRWDQFISKDINYKYLEFSYFNPIGFFGWFVKMKLLKKKNIEKRDAMIMNSLIPFIAWMDYLPLPFGQSVLIVIKKL
jgi:putative flippase GtrA/ubiquinone/menaquinone biosynthesis C-methylase UbiE